MPPFLHIKYTSKAKTAFDYSKMLEGHKLDNRHSSFKTQVHNSQFAKIISL